MMGAPRIVGRLLLLNAALLSSLGLAGCGGTSQRTGDHRYTFAVQSVNPNPTFKLAHYMTLSSPVPLPSKELAHAPLFTDVTAGIYLVNGVTPRGKELCSFSRKVGGSVNFPEANGKTITVKVYGRTTSPHRTVSICRAFETFSLR